MYTVFLLENLKRRRGRPRHRSEDNIRMDIREIGWASMDCMYMAQVNFFL
jgi:hypothetical protein